MKKYHGKRNQYSFESQEEFISPNNMLDKVDDDDFIDVINEIVSDRWLEKYNTEWLKSLRKEINEQRTGYIPAKKMKSLSKAILQWCESRDITFGVGLNEGKYFKDVASSVTESLLQYPFGKVDDFDRILNEHSDKFLKKSAMGGFNKASTPFIIESRELIIKGYEAFADKIEESIVFKKYDTERVQSAERYGFSNIAAHAQLTRKFQDAVVAFSNQKTLREIINRASDGKARVAKMMRRDMGLEHTTLMSESKKVNSVKNIMLFNKCLEDML
jgi:hypothetical protein|tara:strand:- start:6 stop:824 length:819 start_codon:yes stop_codon:yes gene_type:complete